MNDRTSADLLAAADVSTTLDPSERTRCEVWTRVMGYHRPVGEFNAGKQAEHAERRHFIEPMVGGCCNVAAAPQEAQREAVAA